MMRLLQAALPVAVGLLVLQPTAAADVPEKPSSRMRNVEDRLETRVTWGPARAVLDTLVARLERAGNVVTTRNEEKLRIEVERAATLSESNLFTENPDGDERIRMRFEISQPKPREKGYRVTGAIFFRENKGTIGEKDITLDQRQPYRDEIKAYLRGLPSR